MRNYIQAGNDLTLPAPAAVLSGAGVMVGSIFGVAATDATAGEEVVLQVVGVFNLPKPNALAISIGDGLYWDAAGGQVTKTATGNPRIGAAVTAAPSPSGSVDVRLNGSF